MANGPFIRGLGIGLAGAVISGVVLRDTLLLAVAMAGVGVVAGLIEGKRPALFGLWAGQVVAFPVLMAIEFGIMSASIDEFLGLWPLAALVWLAFLGCGAFGFFVGSPVGVALRARS
jgi:hypothetical protein